MKYDDRFIHNVIDEITGPEETNRRAMAKRRHDIYKDGGKAFLVEQITREFSVSSLAEMRLAPINFLKKLVNSLGSVYKTPPTRKTQDAKDQLLVDYYVNELCLNHLMQKANRYYVLAANTVIYARPWLEKDGTWKLRLDVTPSYLYSIIPNQMDKTQIDTIVFSAFVEEGRVTPQSSNPAATGIESFSQERGYKTSPLDLVASNERETALSAEQYVFWSDEQHITTNESGAVIGDSNQDDEQFLNPIGRLPVVNLAKDRDNEPWAAQGEDMVDLTMALQLGWSDIMTIAKHQGFSLLTLVSEEEPKKLKFGLNRALWLRQTPNSPTPSVQFVSPNSPLSEYTEMLDKLTKLFLTTNNMDPGSIGGDAKSASYTSGFHALIAMSDSLQAVEADKPAMMKAEMDLWDVIAKWHNWMLDGGLLDEEAQALGSFSDEFKIFITYPDARPIESEEEKIARIKELDALGLITKKQALKRLNPDANDDQIEALMEEISMEKQANLNKAQEMFQGVPDTTQEGPQPEDTSEEPENITQ